MEVQDGFIIGVFTYCDRWCERCPLTGRCRQFADETHAQKRRTSLERIAFDLDAGLPEPNASAYESKLPPDLEPSFGPDPYTIASARQLRARFDRARRSSSPAVRLAMEAIQHFSMFVPLKMMRALSGAARGSGTVPQSDANGSGKAALLGLERMRAAWQTLIDTQHFKAQEAVPFLAEIARLTRNVERSLPQARAFVRPGFDEPDEVAMLDAKGRRP